MGAYGGPPRADRVVRPYKEFHRAGCPHPAAPGLYRTTRQGPRALPYKVLRYRDRADRVVRPVPHSKITVPLFFSARPERIKSRVSAKGSLVCSPVFISLQATTPAVISSSPRKIT